MNNLQQNARVGLFFVLGIVLIWVTFDTLSGNRFNAHGYALIAGFDDLRGLKIGDEVRMAGVKIGTIETTRLDYATRRAEAVLRIAPQYQVADDAVATVQMSGLIGTEYVAIDLGSAGAPPLKDGAEIRTAMAPDLNTIMAELGGLGQKLDTALSSLTGAFNGNGKEEGLFQRLSRLVNDNSAQITATVANLREITDKINRGQGTIGKLVNDPTLHDQLVASVGQIKAAADQARDFLAGAQDVIDQVKSGKGTVGTLVYDEQTAANLRATLQNIRDVSDKLAKGEGTLGKLIGDDTLYNDLQTTMKKADRAIDGLNDSGPISAVGVVANSLF